MSEFFNYDNPVWRFIGKFFDVFVLNILWMICSIPIVTCGAATTAVYYVALKLARDEEGNTAKDFFKSFRENFIQATIIWIIVLIGSVILYFDVNFFRTTPEVPARNIFLAASIGLCVIWAGIILFVFPLQCRFYNPVKRTLMNAAFMCLRHLPATLGMLLMDLIFPLMALFIVPALQPVTFLFGFPLIAFMNAFALESIFAKYMPKKERDPNQIWPD